jgi:hypothetical protein
VNASSGARAKGGAGPEGLAAAFTSEEQQHRRLIDSWRREGLTAPILVRRFYERKRKGDVPAGRNNNLRHAPEDAQQGASGSALVAEGDFERPREFPDDEYWEFPPAHVAPFEPPAIERPRRFVWTFAGNLNYGNRLTAIKAFVRIVGGPYKIITYAAQRAALQKDVGGDDGGDVGNAAVVDEPNVAPAEGNTNGGGNSDVDVSVERADGSADEELQTDLLGKRTALPRASGVGSGRSSGSGQGLPGNSGAAPPPPHFNERWDLTRRIMCDAIFAPVAAGWFTFETSRPFDAARCGTIPVVAGPRAAVEAAFGTLLGYEGRYPDGWVIAATWAEAARMAKQVMDTPGEVVRLRRLVLRSYQRLQRAAQHQVRRALTAARSDAAGGAWDAGIADRALK